MKPRVLLLLICLFSLNAWAIPSGCEILLETSYGRLIHLFAEKKILTADQLKELAMGSEPQNPFSQVEKDINHLSYRQILDRALELKETRDKWAETKKAIALMAGAAVKTDQMVHHTRIETQNVFRPKLVYKLPYDTLSVMNVVYNQKKDQLVAMNLIPEGTNPTMLNLKTGTIIPDTTKLHIEDVIARKNGEVWVAGFEEKDFIVRKFPGEVNHYSIHSTRGNIFKLYETPVGRIILVRLLEREGLLVLDITDKDEPRELVKVAGHHGGFPAFHVSKKGGVMMAITSEYTTVVYRLASGVMTPLGETRGSAAKSRGIILSADEDGNPIVGETLGENQGYQVVKLVNEEQVEIFKDESLKVYGHAAAFNWNRAGDLILAIGGKSALKTFYLINLSVKGHPQIQVPLSHLVNVPPAWFTLPDGLEVLALSVSEDKAVVLNAGDGAILTKLRSMSSNHVPPTWMKASDGRVYLALDAASGLDVFSVWHPSSLTVNK